MISTKKLIYKMLQKISDIETATEEVCTPSTGWEHYDASYTLTVRKRNGVVSINGALKNSSAITIDAVGTTVFAVATIPVGYRPPQALAFVCQGSGSAVFLCRIATDGTVRIERYRNVVGAAASTNLSAGTWLPINMAWVV